MLGQRFDVERRGVDTRLEAVEVNRATGGCGTGQTAVFETRLELLEQRFPRDVLPHELHRRALRMRSSSSRYA